MLSSGIIVFREVLEAALIISIIAAATRGAAGRSLWILGGVGAGVLGAVIVAQFTDVIADFSEGRGQEMFNAGVLLLAVGMLAWHNIWMSSHARKLVSEMQSVGKAVLLGEENKSIILLVVGLAVLREGSEVVLFMYGISAAGTGVASMYTGGIVGLVLGAAVGYGLYSGLLRIPTRHFFTVTGWMILLLAAGLASQAASYLIQAGMLPTLGNRIWDTSWLIAPGSVSADVLGTLIGYDAQPTGMQLVFYVTTLIAIGGGMLLVSRKQRATAQPQAVAA